MSRKSHGFTLIELLVVVTIIVVLLALLVPAMDKALMQAQMALCGANLKSVASAATTYATANKRTYPHRKAINASGQPNQLNDPWTGPDFDDRFVMKDYVHLDSYLDPMCDDIQIDPSETASYQQNAAQNSPPPFVYSSFYLFYGWQYTDGPGHRGLKKLGERGFSWTAPEGGNGNLFGQAGTWNFNILAGDQNAMTRVLNGFASSHPDSNGLLPLQTLQNEPVDRGPGGLGLNEGFYFVLSRWIIAETSIKRGTLDLNYAYTDGGVSRVNNIAWDEEQRVTSAPIAKDGPGEHDYWLVLPTR